jgi:DNA-binding response OmpR family regulator/two-component sensor histidine kinase
MPGRMSRMPRILNVDDTASTRGSASRTLRDAGYEVVEAQDTTDALSKLEALRPALVVIDAQQPGSGSTELCQTIKQRWPSTMVLQTSATRVSPHERVGGLDEGADGYLIQPIEADELVASVRALLRLHAAEEAKRELNEKLERRIAARTRELRDVNVRLIQQIAQRERAEAALVQSQKMEAVGQLTGSIAHDFNNILASMMGWLHVVRRKSTDADTIAMLDKALGAGERGKRLTLRLLSFSRSDALVTGPVDVRMLVLGMHEWLQQTVGRAIVLHIGIGEGHAIALTDANQLELALLNLAINARDAMPSGGHIAVDVSARSLHTAQGRLSAGDYVVIEVRDSGVGMTPEVAEKAFDPFFTTKPVGRGTGLGLAQVANLARLSAGAAVLRSAPGEGTTVTLWLAAAAADAAAAPQPYADVGSVAGRGERVLVVDDEADIRGTICELLRYNGYHVDSVASGAEALAAVQGALPHLVLLDLMLPGMSGIDVAQQLQASHPGLPILFVSGHAELDLLRASVPHARLLRKPFQSEELYAEVRRCLDGPGESAARARDA